MKLKEFIILSEVANKALLNESLAKLKKPVMLGGKEVPVDLNSLTMGQLMMLQTIDNERDLLLNTSRIIMDVNPEGLEADKVIGFVLWVSEQVKEIGKMFSSLKVKHTSEEIEAGIDQLDFGMFGLVDWYARRMGITDHEEVEKVPWVRVYTCMKMEIDTMNYEKRLRDIYHKRHDTKTKR